jgi:Family of unknown function (DUF5694)
MINRSLVFVFTLLAAGNVPVQTQVDPSTLDSGMAGPRTKVLVLGTVHLANAPDGFEPESLQPVLDKLAAYKPDIITVEQISGEECDLMARHASVYAPEDVKTYCLDPAAAKAATGLDVPAAIAEVKRTLKIWPENPNASQRRHLAALFFAANDAASALVQWLYLPQAERHAGDGLDDTLVAQVHELAAQGNNETNRIAARLAVRLDLQRLFPIDDHTGDNADIADAAAYGKAIQQAWDGATAKAQPMRDREAALWKSGDMLALYRFVNNPENLRVAIDSDFGAALRDKSPEHYGRIYVAGWETRNLRMVANVHAAFREHPGARVLSIVGSSHKPWFDSLLGQMQGLEVVDAEQVLK